MESKIHFLRDQVNNGRLELIHCNTKLQVADVFTKPLKTDRFSELRENFGVASLKSLN